MKKRSFILLTLLLAIHAVKVDAKTCEGYFHKISEATVENLPAAPVDMEQLPALVSATQMAVTEREMEREASTELTREVIQRLSKEFMAVNSIDNEQVHKFMTSHALNNLRKISFFRKLWAYEFRPFTRSRFVTEEFEQSVAQYQTLQWEDQLKEAMKISLIIIELVESENLFDLLMKEKMGVAEAKEVISWFRVLLKMDALGLPLIIAAEMVGMSEAKLNEIKARGLWARMSKPRYPAFKLRKLMTEGNFGQRVSNIARAKSFLNFEGELSETSRILLFTMGYSKTAQSQANIPDFDSSRDLFPPKFAEKFGFIVDEKKSLQKSIPEQIAQLESLQSGDEELIAALREELAKLQDVNSKRVHAQGMVTTRFSDFENDPATKFSLASMEEVLNEFQGLFNEQENYEFIKKYLKVVQVVHLRRSSNDRLKGQTYGSKANFEDALELLELLKSFLPRLPISESDQATLRRDLTSNFLRRLLPSTEKYPKAFAAKEELLELVRSEDWYNVDKDQDFYDEQRRQVMDLEDRIENLDGEMALRRQEIDKLRDHLAEANLPFDITEDTSIIDRYAPWLSIVGGIKVNEHSGGLITLDDGEVYFKIIERSREVRDFENVASLVSRDELLLGQQSNRVLMETTMKASNVSIVEVTGDITNQDLVELGESLIEKKAIYSKSIGVLKKQVDILDKYIEVVTAYLDGVRVHLAESEQDQLLRSLNPMINRLNALKGPIESQIVEFDRMIESILEAEDILRRGSLTRSLPAPE